MPNTRLINPHSEQEEFGRVPACKSGQILFPPGFVYLTAGRHIGPNKGFGAAHIWAEHAKEMEAAGFKSLGDVPRYVATLICRGTPLLYEGGNIKSTRLIAARGATGTAILEQRGQAESAFWVVITAFSANKKHGVRVGTVLDV